MNQIITQNPEEILQSSDAQIFLIGWSSSHGTFLGTGGGGFQNAEYGGKMHSPAVERKNVVEEYFKLVNVAKSHSIIKDGRIEIVPLPSFKKYE